MTTSNSPDTEDPRGAENDLSRTGGPADAENPRGAENLSGADDLRGRDDFGGTGHLGGADDLGGTDDPGGADDPGGTGSPSAPGLSARDEAVLAVESRSWQGPGPKERAIREQLGISPTRYYQLLNALLDDPQALAHAPVTVNRLRRVRDARRGRR